MGIYKVGFCPMCGTQIQVQDTMGRWVGAKTNFRQADLIWADGHHCRTIICKDCLPKADAKELFEIITAPNSYASNRSTLDMLEKKGPPIKIQELRR
jgi:hypothetical protein